MAQKFFGVVHSIHTATVSTNHATTSSSFTTTSGNLLVAIVTSDGNVIGATPVSDSFSNTWVQAVGSTGTSSGFAAMFYVANCTGGASHTFTFTPTANAFLTITVLEIEGAALTSVLSGTNGAVFSTAAHGSGNITSNSSVPEIFVGGGSNTGATNPTLTTVNPGTWWQVIAVSGAITEGCMVGYRMVDPSVTDQFAWTTGARNEGTVIAGFKMAVAAAAGGASAHTFVGAFS